MTLTDDRDRDVIIIGGGQAGLSLAYYLRRADVDFVILDAEPQPGGAWRHGWESLRLFSPAGWSSLPGWPMSVTGLAGPTRLVDRGTGLGAAVFEVVVALPLCEPGFYGLKHAAGP